MRLKNINTHTHIYIKLKNYLIVSLKMSLVLQFYISLICYNNKNENSTCIFGGGCSPYTYRTNPTYLIRQYSTKRHNKITFFGVPLKESPRFLGKNEKTKRN